MAVWKLKCVEVWGKPSPGLVAGSAAPLAGQGLQNLGYLILATCSSTGTEHAKNRPWISMGMVVMRNLSHAKSCLVWDWCHRSPKKSCNSEANLSSQKHPAHTCLKIWRLGGYLGLGIEKSKHIPPNGGEKWWFTLAESVKKTLPTQVHEQLPSPKMLDKGQSFDPPIRRPAHNGGGTNLRIQHILLCVRCGTPFCRVHWHADSFLVSWPGTLALEWLILYLKPISWHVFFRPTNSHVPEEGSAVQEEHLGKELKQIATLQLYLLSWLLGWFVQYLSTECLWNIIVICHLHHMHLP